MLSFVTTRLGKTRLYQALFLLATVTFIGLSVQFSAIGSSTGKTDAYESGCTSCHGASSSSSTTFQITSGSGNFTVQTGSTTEFTITVSNPNNPKAGINIAVQNSQSGGQFSGSLAAINSDLKKVSAQLTHNGQPKDLTSGSVDFTFEWTAPSEAGTYYIKAAANVVNGNGSSDSGDEWNIMTPQAITVVAPPSITVSDPDGGESMCPGSNYTIKWTSNDVTNVKIELSENGGNSYDVVATNSTSASTGSYVYAVPGGLTPGDQYKVKITSLEDSGIFDESDATFNVPGDISISADPADNEACQASQAVFQVQADGIGLNYQWRKDGTNIAGANASNLTVSNVEQDDEGNYDCVVSNDCGTSATSASAELSVIDAPSIVVQPQSATVCEGSNFAITIETNEGEYDIEWYKDGELLDDETTKQLNIDNIQPEDAGEYYAKVLGFCPPDAVSDTATVVVNSEPQLLTDLVPMKTCIGDSVDLEVYAEGGDLEYEWKKNNQIIEDFSERILTISEVSEDDLTTYEVRIFNDCGEVLSSKIALTQYEDITITKQPASHDVFVGGNVVLSVTYTGDAEDIQWQKDGADLEGENESQLRIIGAELSDAGDYAVVLSNNCETATSQTATLTVQDQPSGPILTLDVNPLDFGNVGLEQSKDMQAVIQNTGDAELEITNMTITGDNALSFAIVDQSLPVTIPAESEISITISFTPAEAGDKIAEVEFESNSAVETTLELTGVGGAYSISASVEEVNFENVKIDDSKGETITLTNDGNFDLTGISLSIGGPQSSQFSIVSPTEDFDLAIDGTQEIVVSFTPSAEALAQALLTISSDQLENILDVNLQGTGVVSVFDGDILVSHSIYPNPASESITIDLSLENPGDVRISVVDINGNELYTDDGSVISGSYRFDWDLRDSDGNRVSSGNYRMVIENSGRFITLPLIISK